MDGLTTVLTFFFSDLAKRNKMPPRKSDDAASRAGGSVEGQATALRTNHRHHPEPFHPRLHRLRAPQARNTLALSFIYVGLSTFSVFETNMYLRIGCYRYKC